MRRAVSALFCALLFLCVFGADAYALNAETRRTETGYAVVIEGPEDMCAGTLTVSYDPESFTLTDCAVGDSLRGATTALNPSFRKDAIRLTWVSAEPISADGAVLNIAGAGTSPNIESLRVSDADGRPVQTYVAKFTETQPPALELGEDANADGRAQAPEADKGEDRGTAAEAAEAVKGGQTAPADGTEAGGETAREVSDAETAAGGGGTESARTAAGTGSASTQAGTGGRAAGEGAPAPALTKDGRQKNLIMLSVGNATALFEGGRTPIDPANGEVKPYVKNGRTFVPLRYIAESFGARVDWLRDTNEARIALDGVTVTVRIGESAYSVNGESKSSDAASELSGDRTFVPVRFVAEALGKRVYWEDREKIVIISDTEWVEARSAEKEVLADAIEAFGV
jgi:hypothetical protein